MRTWIIVGLLLACLGCGTTRMTDTQRTATEQLLISNAVDRAVEQIDFRPLTAKRVYLDAQYLDGTVDKGYLVSSLRQSLLAHGCLLQEDRTKSTYVVEVRSGAVGTDRHSLLVGVPQMTVPTFIPGQPSQIPEIPVAKKNDAQGVAKIAVFAYNRVSGRRVWQSGIAEAGSEAKDMWVAGMGPFRKGTIVQGTELAGEDLPLAHGGSRLDDHHVPQDVGLNTAIAWTEPPPSKLDLPPFLKMLVTLMPGDRTHGQGNGVAASASAGNKRTDSSGSAKAASNSGNNLTGQPVSESSKILASGLAKAGN